MSPLVATFKSETPRLSNLQNVGNLKLRTFFPPREICNRINRTKFWDYEKVRGSNNGTLTVTQFVNAPWCCVYIIYTERNIVMFTILKINWFLETVTFYLDEIFYSNFCIGIFDSFYFDRKMFLYKCYFYQDEILRLREHQNLAKITQNGQW